MRHASAQFRVHGLIKTQNAAVRAGMHGRVFVDSLGVAFGCVFFEKSKRINHAAACSALS
jgi:hypothetical protein